MIELIYDEKAYKLMPCMEEDPLCSKELMFGVPNIFKELLNELIYYDTNIN